MASRGGEEEEGEHHRNPFLSIGSSKASSSKLQFRNDISRALWDEKKGMGEIVEKKGSMWTTTGIIRNGKLYCSIEEILFLVERGALHVVLSDGNSLTVGDLYKKIAQEKYGCSWEAFEAYRHLKTLGYIIGRHGIPWTMKDPDEEYGISILLEGMLIDDLKLTFDVYLPNSKFRKSSPGDSSFLLCVLRGNPPLKREVESLQRNSGGIPIKFCYVNHGLVSFFCFDKVTIPVCHNSILLCISNSVYLQNTL
ncbi:hypothetical protein KSP39_PZI010974 [Platanthera zijinensis]|uniref:tRNA-splicing endonuclease subunit Sen54 N-terminal domain-containing protein n=1 Tax=Platanthera zijinensis TaxID=2320716 RepID=A0AAP0BJZ9_9ASPA